MQIKCLFTIINANRYLILKKKNCFKFSKDEKTNPFQMSRDFKMSGFRIRNILEIWISPDFLYAWRHIFAKVLRCLFVLLLQIPPTPPSRVQRTLCLQRWAISVRSDTSRSTGWICVPIILDDTFRGLEL